jgi:hypothetical protein
VLGERSEYHVQVIVVIEHSFKHTNKTLFRTVHKCLRSVTVSWLFAESLIISNKTCV